MNDIININTEVIKEVTETLKELLNMLQIKH